MRAVLLSVVLVAAVGTPDFADQRRELVYGGAATLGGQVVPLYDKGYLIYLHRPKRLQVFRPDNQLAFDLELPCPGKGECTPSATAVDARGNIAVGFGYLSESGRTGGIRLLNPQGQQTRFIETSLYVPTALCFDRNGDLWSLGWQRDSVTRDSETTDDYSLVRKYSAAGNLSGQYLPRSLWHAKESAPGMAGGGYWTMYAASDRIGALFHESYANNPPEWVELSLSGELINRTVLDCRLSFGRAYAGNGRLYARFHTAGDSSFELRMLETAKGTWTALPDNLPDDVRGQGIFLLGADGDDLVYRVGPGNVRLLRAKPGVR